MTAPRRPGTTVDDLYQTLRDRILHGDYFPGLRLSQQALAAEMNVSRTPLREALSRLAAEGLVVAEANRGVEIAPIRNDQAEQSYAIRLLIEPPTIGAVLNDITDAEIDKMHLILEEMERTSDRIQDFQNAHLRFHQMTLQYYPEDFRKLIDSLYATIFRHQRIYFSHPNTAEHFTRVDRAFCEAVRARRSAAARQIMEFHLTDAALGLILDVDPDYQFHTLLVALRGIGITLATDGDRRVRRPTAIRWSRSDFDEMPSLKTNNLHYAPEIAAAAAKGAVPSLAEAGIARRRRSSSGNRE